MQDGVKPQWQYLRLQNDGWRPMDDKVQETLETLYETFMACGPTYNPILCLGTSEYEIDFVDMHQRNVSTGRTRPIRRVGLSNQIINDTSQGYCRSQGSRNTPSTSSDGGAAIPFAYRDIIRTAFETFCGQHVGMDNKTFVKFCRDCSLFDRKFKETDADILFVSAVQQGQRRIPFQRFEYVLHEVARRKGVHIDAVCGCIMRCRGPSVRATSPEPVRQYDRHGSYERIDYDSVATSSKTSSLVSPRRSIGSRASSPRGRCFSPGPGRYDPLLQGRRVTGGVLSSTAVGHNLDFSTEFLASRSLSPCREVHGIPKYPRKHAAGGNYFGTAHVASTSGHLTPGPGAYDTSKRKERVKGGVIPVTERQLKLASEI